MRRLLPWIAGAVVLGVLVVVGLGQAGDQQRPAEEPAGLSLAEQRRALAGAPPQLAALHRQANQLIDATPSEVEARIRALRGTPVVVNKWASWCGPCVAEFPVFQEAVAKLGKEVAFLGLNSGNPGDGAQRFLQKRPVAYPSFRDPRERIARRLGAPTNYPITVFYDREGTRFVHQGPYTSLAALEADVRRYGFGDPAS